MCEMFGIHVHGPLEPFVSGFLQELAVRGYSGWSATSYLVLMGHLSRWLGQHGWVATDLTVERMQEFVAERRARGYAKGRSNGGMMAVLVAYLRSIGAIPEEKPPVPKTPLERSLDDFAKYLTNQRGLAQGTVSWYCHVAQKFLLFCGMAVQGFEVVTAEKVISFFLSESKCRGIGSLHNVGVALRSFLRFAYLQGQTPESLEAAVLPAPGWRDTEASRSLSAQQVSRLLDNCDRETNAGIRNFAILTLLARLGLRANEVASLKLDDVDWSNGEITVTGKGNSRERLPLPVDVGQALANYCRQARPNSASRTVFLKVRAPYTGLSNAAISDIVTLTCERAGLPRASAHWLRHGLARAMRRAGAPLVEITRILRHRRPVTTAYYTKEDKEALVNVVRRWPEAAL